MPKLRSLDKSFDNKHFNISFTPTSLDEGAKQKNLSTDEYINYCRDLFNNANVLELHDVDKSQTNSREEIRLVLQDLGFVFFCMTRAGKDLGCFRVIKINDISEVKNINRAFIANCSFLIEETNETLKAKNANVVLDDANELKQVLKVDFEQWQKIKKQNPQEKIETIANNLNIKEDFAEIKYKEIEEQKPTKSIDKKATYKELGKKFSQIDKLFASYNDDKKVAFKKIKDKLSQWKPSAKMQDDEFCKEIKSFYNQATKVYFDSIAWRTHTRSIYYGDRKEYKIDENLSLLDRVIDYFDNVDEPVYSTKIIKVRLSLDRLRIIYEDEDYASDSTIFEEIYDELKNIFFPSVDRILEYDFGGVKISQDILGEKSIIPQVILYEEKRAKDSDMITTPSDFGKSSFFQSLCKAIDSKIAQQITQCYSNNSSDSYRENLEENINKQIRKTITKKFNELYQGGSEYYFKLRLESARISLSISKKNTIKEPLTLSQQSQGFQWFFNFFFNFLHSYEINSGDIILLDELGGSLSIPTQRDLRDFLKDFARRNHIAFVAAVHTPYMIDINHLDEIRIIEQRQSSKHSKSRNQTNSNHDICGVDIINDFSMIDDELDSLAKIKQAFGVDNHFSMVGGDSKIIFVEGITDYNYLTKFKLLYRVEKGKNIDIAFIPIGGLGKIEDGKSGLSKKQQEILQKLPKLARAHKESYAILLVDNDKAGKAIKANETDTLKIITLNEAFDGQDDFKYIENLFDKADAQRLNLLDFSGEPIKSSKKSSLSRWVKNSEIEVDSATKENFYKLLEYLATI